MCLCVCLSVCLRGYLEPHARPIFMCMLHMVVPLSSSGRVTKSKGERAVFWGLLPYCQCILQHIIRDVYKTPEPIEMPLGMMSRVGGRYHVLDGDPIFQGEGAIFCGNRGGAL